MEIRSLLAAFSLACVILAAGCSSSRNSFTSSAPAPPEVRWADAMIMIDPAPEGFFYEATTVFEGRTAQTVVIDGAIPALDRNAKIELRPESRPHTVAPRTAANMPYEGMSSPVRYRESPKMWDFEFDDDGMMTKITIMLKPNGTSTSTPRR